MADPAAYQPTTEPIVKQPDSAKIHLVFKVIQLLFSFVAFICEEIITQCETCFGLYIFEFVSCSAFLICILMLVVYLSPLKSKINIPSFKKVDFWITLAVGVLFVIASIMFVSTIEKSELSSVSVAFGFLASLAFLAELYFMFRSNYLQKKEKPAITAGVNGGAEGQPLNRPVQENNTNN